MSALRNRISELKEWFEGFKNKSLKLDKCLPLLDKKSEQLAIEFRTKGNELFHQNLFFEALNEYTQSLFYCESKLQKAYAFGNRSAVLFKLGFFKETILDIEMALKNDFPKEKISRLNDRLKQSYNAKENGTRSAFYCLSLTKNCENDFIDSSIEIVSSSDYGLNVVAQCDISPGKELAMTTALYKVLDPDVYLTHCLFCHTRCMALIPCLNCSKVGFCSEKCFVACDSHNFACGYLSSIYEHDGVVGLLAMNIVSSVFPDAISPALQQFFDSQNDTDELKADNLFQNTFQDVFLLATNCNYRKENDIRLRLSSAMLYEKILKNNGYYINCAKKYEDVRLEVIFAIFILVQIVPTNAHTELETIISSTCQNRIVSHSLFPFYSLINHACSPNVSRVSFGKRTCLKALLPIAKGDQLFDNYSINFVSTNLLNRQTSLRNQYHFTCSCVACKENWQPLLDSFEVGIDWINDEILTNLFELLFDDLQQAPEQLFKNEQSIKKLNCLTQKTEELVQKLSMDLIVTHNGRRRIFFIIELIKRCWDLEGNCALE